MEKKPAFYLVSSEGYGLETPRKCWRAKCLRSESRNDLLLTMVEPPIICRLPNGSEVSLAYVVLAARHRGFTVNNIQQWPLYVHVARLLRSDVEADEAIKSQDLETIAWAELYRTEKSAKAAVHDL